MKYVVLLGLCLLKSTFGFSQNEYQKSVDSLYMLINKEYNGTLKIRHYLALCDIYKKTNIIKFDSCNEQLGFILQKTKVFNKYYGFYYDNKARISEDQNNYKQAVVYAAKANALFYQHKDWDNYILNCTTYAFYLSINEQNDKALMLLNKTLALAISKQSKYIANVYFGLCEFYNGNSDYVRALENAKKAMTNEVNVDGKRKIYILIAAIYNSLKNFDKALEYNDLASKQVQSFISSYLIKIQKAEILFDMKRYQEALLIALNTQSYFKKNYYLDLYEDNLYFIASCYLKLRKYNLANTYIDKVLKPTFERRTVEIQYRIKKAEICLALNDLTVAQIHLDKSLELLKDDDYFEQRIEVYQIKEQLEENLGNYKAALFYNKKVAEIKELNKINYDKEKIHQLEVDLDVTEKENSIKALKIEQLKKQMEITNKDNYLFYISILLLIAIISVLFYVKNFKTIKNKNIIIENEKLLVKKSLAEKETLLKEIHHRVKNNLQLVMSLLNIQAQKSNQNIADFLEVSKSRILSMALIHENLYQSDNLSKVDIKEYIQNLIEVTQNTYNAINPNIHIQLETDEISLDIQTAVPLGLIMNELVNNAFKHGFPNHRKGVITIKLKERSKYYELIIKDTGVGISPKNSNQKTLGLKLVEELVFQLDGTLNIENDNGMGYTIKFKENNLEKV